MPKIHSIAIRGIRCFGPSQCFEVNLDQPLTLIVGTNGSGKTTIIEALRYATTGLCPPGTSKGKTFVMDPNLYGENEVKAQIKLEFTGIDGQEVVATRSMSMKQRKTVTTFQTLESLLEINDPASRFRTSLTGRCADLDSAVPAHLGVPPAILDFVIFCHQDDSLWPLSEPAVLKKKFDEIFESGKLSNIITDVKKDRKALATSYKEGKIVFDHLMKERERAEKIQKRIDQNKKKVEELSRQRKTYSHQINDVAQEIGSLLETIQEVNNKESDLKILTNTKEQKEKIFKDLQNRMIEYHESDEELIKLKNEFESNRVSQQTIIDNLNQKVKKYRSDLGELQSSLNNLSTEKINLQVEHTTHEKRLSELDELMQTIIHDCQFSNLLSAFPTEKNMQNFKSLLQSSIEERKNKLEKEREQLQYEEDFLTNKLSELRSKSSSLKHTRDSTTKARESNMIKKSKFEKEIDRMELFSESDLMILNTSLEEVRSELEEFVQDDLINKITLQIEVKQREYNELDKQLSRLQELTTNQAKLEYKRTEKHKKTSMIQTTWELLSIKLTELLDKDPDIETLERDWNDRVDSFNRENKELEQQKESVDRDLSNIKAKIDMMKLNIEAKNQECHNHMQKLKEICGNKDYIALLKEAEDQLAYKQNEMGLFYSTSQMYEHYMDRTEREKDCPLCHRPFAGEDKLNEFIERLKKFTTNLPEERSRQERNLEDIKKRCQRLRDLQPNYIAIRSLQSEICELKKQIEEQEKYTNEYEFQLMEIDNRLSQSQENMFNVLELSKEVQEIIRLKNDLKDLDKEINALEPFMKSANESKNKREELRQKVRTLKKDIEELNNVRELRIKEETDLRNRLHTLEMGQCNKQNCFNNRNRIQQQIEELNKEILCQEKLISPLFNQITKVDNEIKDLMDELQEFRNRRSESEEAIMSELNKLQLFYDSFTKIEREIASYNRSGKKEKLDEYTKQVERVQQNITEKERCSDEFKDKIHKLDMQIGQTRQTERDIQDNIEYRSLKVEIEKLQEQIEKLCQELENQGLTSYKERLAFLQDDQNRMTSEFSSITGNMEQLKVSINIDKEDLKTQYKNIEARFKEQWAIKHGDQEAITEIDRLISELENTLMNYHTRKMQEINNKIYELWDKAYNGDDIERIEIRSEQESTQNNRSYNYRVVMTKNRSELDMRGRCSAGQRMLASIIIRMALAECFSKGFGMFVLDEPTTNLDENHINNLSESLRR
jgi:DNA repair protein RAD50